MLLLIFETCLYSNREATLLKTQRAELHGIGPMWTLDMGCEQKCLLRNKEQVSEEQ